MCLTDMIFCFSLSDFSDVAYSRTEWLGYPPPVQPVIVPKVHCSREGFYISSQPFFFFLGKKRKTFENVTHGRHSKMQRVFRPSMFAV